MSEPTGRYIFQEVLKTGYVNVLEKRAFPGSPAETGAYSVEFLLTPDGADHVEIRRIILEVARAEWPKLDIVSLIKSGDFHVPLSNGNARIASYTASSEAEGRTYAGQRDFYKDKIVLKAKSKMWAPKLDVVQGNKLVGPLTSDQLAAHGRAFYSGVEGGGEIRLATYSTKGGSRGVTAYLQRFLSLNRGEKIDSGRPASEVFAHYAGHISSVDPTAGDDDNISF